MSEHESISETGSLTTENHEVQHTPLDGDNSQIVNDLQPSNAQPHLMTTESQIIPVGQQLAHARNELNISIAQIASQLKWSQRQITELEAGNYSALPDPSMVRGFVRSYAKLVKLNGDALIAQLAAELAKLPIKNVDRKQLDTPFQTGRMPWLGREQNQTQWVFAGLFLVCLTVLAAFLYRAELSKLFHNVMPESAISEGETHIKDVSVPTVATNIQLPTTIASQSASPSNDQSVANNVNNSSIVNAQTADQKIDTNEAINKKEKNPPSSSAESTIVTQSNSSKHAENIPVLTAQSNITATQKTTANSTIQSSNLQTKEVTFSQGNAGIFVLKFKQDSWIQIKRLDGSTVTSGIFKGGSQEIFKVDSPMTVIIGNAPGVEASLRGQNLELKSQFDSNVVNLSIK